MLCPSCQQQIPESHRFCGYCGLSIALPAADAQPAQNFAENAVSPHVKAERRDVTILFADVIGFTSLCERLDPEDVHTLMNECFDGLSVAIREEGGYVDKYIGDCVMALFGAPVAHEDDAARACQAALGMRVFLAGFSERNRRRIGIALHMRIGIHAGLVVAGRIGSAQRQDYSVLGDAVNMAARLESSAAPDSVLVSREVARRAGGAFEFGEVRLLSVKGKELPVETQELLRRGGARHDADREPHAMPLVGREEALQTLLARWQQAASQSRWIELRAETGVGKTRLVQEAERRIVGRRLITVNVTADTARRPFGLVRLVLYEILREINGRVTRPDTREAFVTALSLLDIEVALYVDALWHLAAPSNLAVPVPDPDPQSFRLTLERGLALVLTRFAERMPSVALFLDSYGVADEASASFLESFITRPHRWPLPIIVALRYGGRKSLFPNDVIVLRPLTEAEMRTLLDELVPDPAFSGDVRQELIRRASGVPEYLEEMVQALTDQGVLSETGDGRFRVGQESARGINLPSSLRVAMVSRLDHQEPAHREMLGYCAVQGVEFRLDVAQAIQDARGTSSEPVAVVLQTLQARGLVKPLADGRDRWMFRQPLMQEACYETLLRHDRRQLHAETARGMILLAGSVQAVAPELLAHHYERADAWLEAAEANLRAGERASELYLNDEALRRYAHVFEAVRRIEPQSPQHRQIEAAAHAGLARVHLRVGAYAQARDAAVRISALSGRFDDQAEADRLLAAAYASTGETQQAESLLLGVIQQAAYQSLPKQAQGQLLLSLAELYHRAGRMADALSRIRHCREVAGHELPSLSIRVDMLEGTILHAAGQYAEAAQLYTRAYDSAQRAGSLSERARASNSLGNVSRDSGQYVAARDHFQRALELWERTGDAECIAGARNNLGNLAMSVGDYAAAREHHRNSLAVCSEIGNIHGAAMAQANLAILAIEEGNGSGAVTSAEEALVTLGDSGNVLLRGLILVVLGEAEVECGEATIAEGVFRQVLSEFHEADHPLTAAGAYRGLGRVASLRRAYSQAVQELERAIGLYERLNREQEATRARLYLAEAAWRLGQVDRARSELDDVRARLAVMRATRDSARADRLFREMRSGRGRPAGHPPSPSPHTAKKAAGTVKGGRRTKEKKPSGS